MTARRPGVRVILASASPTRAAMLRAAGLEFETVGPRVDEDEVKAALRAEGASPRDQADALAEMKALRVSARHPDALVIGADQILDLNGDALDKPADLDVARAQLRRLRNTRHDLLSAAVIAESGAPVWRSVGRARLTMRDFSEDFLEAYLTRAGAEILSACGGYHIEGVGAQLFSRTEGDHFAILGLPLFETLGFLRLRGALAE